MRGPYQILLPLFSLFLVRVDLTDLKPLNYKVQLIKFLDADTALVQVENYKLSVRLRGIDAPEKKQGSAGSLAKKCLESIILKRNKFDLRIDGFDIYGRILGDLDHLGLDLIKQGCVTLYPHAKFNSKLEKGIYLRAITRAKQKKLGLWNSEGFQQPKLWRKKFNRRNGYRYSQQQVRSQGPYRPEHKLLRKAD